MTNGGVWGSKKEKSNSAIKGSGQKFNYKVVALQFVTCDKKKEEWKKKHKNEIKGKNPSFLYSNTIPFP